MVRTGYLWLRPRTWHPRLPGEKVHLAHGYRGLCHASGLQAGTSWRKSLVEDSCLPQSIWGADGRGTTQQQGTATTDQTQCPGQATTPRPGMCFTHRLGPLQPITGTNGIDPAGPPSPVTQSSGPLDAGPGRPPDSPMAPMFHSGRDSARSVPTVQLCECGRGRWMPR